MCLQKMMFYICQLPRLGEKFSRNINFSYVMKERCHMDSLNYVLIKAHFLSDGTGQFSHLPLVPGRIWVSGFRSNRQGNDRSVPMKSTVNAVGSTYWAAVYRLVGPHPADDASGPRGSFGKKPRIFRRCCAFSCSTNALPPLRETESRARNVLCGSNLHSAFSGDRRSCAPDP